MKRQYWLFNVIQTRQDKTLEACWQSLDKQAGSQELTDAALAILQQNHASLAQALGLACGGVDAADLAAAKGVVVARVCRAWKEWGGAL